MASQWIEIVGSESRVSGKIRSVVDNTRRLVEEVDRLKDTLDQIAAGADWPALAAAFGWAATPENATKAETVYNLITGAKAKLDDATVAAMTDRLG